MDMSRYALICFLIFLPFGQCRSSNPPVIVEQPQDILAELDKPMALHCRAESDSLDDLRVNWYKDGRLVTMDPNARIITEFMALHIINSMPQDAGAYYCVAENSHGRTQSRTAKVQFIKLEKEFLVSPSSSSASIGERVRLRCEPPNGSPPPIVYWNKDGKNLSVPLDHHDLVLASVQANDFGAYRCIAFNGILRQSSVAHLTEFHRPKIHLRPTSSRIELERGQSIELQCQVESVNEDDQYQIEWHFGHSHGPLVGRNGRYDISSVDFNQSGVYVCVVSLNNARRRHVFTEQVFLAVHQRLRLSNNEEKIVSYGQINGYAGRSLILDCPLPMLPTETITWSIVNRTDLSLVNNQRFDYLDKNHYRLKIRRVEEFDQEILFECFYQTRRSTSQALIRLHVDRQESPPIVLFAPNNQTVPLGVEVIFPCQTKEPSRVQWWFIGHHRPSKAIRIENSKKYRIESNHDLIIRQAEKSDAGIYKCILTNRNEDETSWMAQLSVEDPRSNAIFQRVERKDLPQSPTQPLAIAINSNSIELAWNHPSTDILGYLIEYFNLNSDEKHFEWKRLHVTSKKSSQLISNLQIGSTYQFMVRARNSFGYGQPSPLSELIETRSDQQTNDEFVRLLDPISIQETSVTLSWTLTQSSQAIDRLSISLISEKDQNERIETINNRNNLTSYTITNLRPNTDYTVRLIPLNGLANRLGRPSNAISIRTSESMPSSAPMDVQVELTSITSLSIRWNPPLESEQNGRIIAYKVNCLGANESTSIRLLNISADAKGLHIKSLIENMQYCISVAARTRLGYGPYSQPICVTMNADFLKMNRKLYQSDFKRRFREAFSQPWFLPLIIVTSILFSFALFYACWLCFHNLFRQHGHRMKFASSNSSSSSSSNQFVEMPVQKTLSNGTRYDLIKDTPPPLPPPIPSSSTALWTDTIASGIRLQCCSTTIASASSHSEHEPHPMNIHKNPINSLLQQSRQQQQQQQQQLNPYATTGIFQHYHPSPPAPPTSSTLLPSYSDSIRSPGASYQLTFEQQQNNSVQYQPPWMDHPSTSFPYRSHPHTPYHNHPTHCVHCTSQSHSHPHPHTPSTIRTTTHSPSTRTCNPIPSQTQGSPHIKTNGDIRWPMDTPMNSSPVTKRQSQYAPPPLIPPPSNPMMINSLGGETMTTSWASSTDASHAQSVSSSSTDKNEQRKILDQASRSSSEGSIFSDSDNAQDESNLSNLLDHERRPTFLMPTV